MPVPISKEWGPWDTGDVSAVIATVRNQGTTSTITREQESTKPYSILLNQGFFSSSWLPGNPITSSDRLKIIIQDRELKAQLVCF